MANIRKSIRIDAADLKGGLNKFGVRAQKKTETILEDLRYEIIQYMRQHRPWTDRTSNARLSLNAKVENPKKGYYRMALQHGVIYGKKLEYGYPSGNKYPILAPTQEKYKDELLNRLKGVLQ